MLFLNNNIQALGLGCWPIGGEMYGADGTSLGYTNVNDKDAINAIEAALTNGIRLFDTAAAYGAGHSERLLGKTLGNNSDALIITKIGIAIDEQSKTLTGEDIDPATVQPAIERCLQRLQREQIDLLLLHPNETTVTQAAPLFDEMDKARQAGKITAYGWSTDITGNAEAMAKRDGFVAVEYAMHVLMDAPNMQGVTQDNNLHSLIRSPLAMGLLSGKYTSDSTLPSSDVRASNPGWAKYYIDGKPNPDYIKRFQAVRELLQSDGRTTVQGALGWLWGKSENHIPVPGARTVQQVEGLAGALAHGPLPEPVMNEIEQLLGFENVSPGNEAR